MDESEGRQWFEQYERDRDADETFVPLAEQQEAIETREDFVRFVEALRADLRAHPTWWENTSLEAYLDTIASVTEDLDQGYKNQGLPLPEQPSWRIIGEILLEPV